jgi:hypothetical protein
VRALATVCITCATLDPSAFAEAEALFCLECAIRWAVCLECDELFLLAESGSDVRCHGCAGTGVAVIGEYA